MKGMDTRMPLPSGGLPRPTLRLEGRRITFVEPPFRVPRHFIDYPMFMNLGLLHNAALLEDLGAEVRVVDAIYSAERLPLTRGGEVDLLGLPPGEVAERVRATDPHAVVLHASFFANPRYLERTLLPDLASALRASLPGVPLLLADMFLGGLNYFPYDGEAAASALGARAVLQGETDALLPAALLQVLDGRGARGPLVERGDRAGGRFPRVLDDLPDPAFHLLDMERYFRIQAEAQRENLVPEHHSGERILPFMSSRGCPYACVFCTQQILDLAWRGYSAGRLCASMDRLKARWGVQRVLFLDDLMNLDGPRFRVFTRHMAEIGLPWDAVNGFRADRLDAEVLGHMRDAGNRKATVSAESGDPEVLDRIVRKGMEVADIDRTARAAAGLEMPFQIHYVIGFPGERREQINRTLCHAARMRRDHGAIPLVQYATPVEGTRLHRLIEERGLWADPSDRHRDVSGLFYRDSVLRTADFDPALLRSFRTSFDLAMQALDASPRRLDLRPETRLEEVRAWVQGAPGCRRRILLAGAEPLLHPDLPEVARAIEEAGGVVDAVWTGGRPLLKGAVRTFLRTHNIRSIILLLRATEAPSEGLAEALARLAGAGIRTRGILGLSGAPGEAEAEALVSRYAAAGVRELILHVSGLPPGGGAEIPGILDRLAATAGRPIAVHGLSPCLLPPEILDPGHPHRDRQPWRLVPAFDGTGLFATGARREIPECAACPFRVGCPGFSELRAPPFEENGGPADLPLGGSKVRVPRRTA